MSRKLHGVTSPYFAIPVLATLAVIGLGPKPGPWLQEDEVAFMVRAGGVPAEGYVKNYKTDLQFNPASPEQASLRLILDMHSTSTGWSTADRAATSAEFLDADRYPTAELSAKGAKPNGDGKYIMEGQFTLKGVTKPIRLPLSIKVKDNVASLSGATTVNRLDFGLGPESYMGYPLDKDVKLQFALSGITLHGVVSEASAEASKETVQSK